jgi:hypothetical protein
MLGADTQRLRIYRAQYPAGAAHSLKPNRSRHLPPPRRRFREAETIGLPIAFTFMDGVTRRTGSGELRNHAREIENV